MAGSQPVDEGLSVDEARELTEEVKGDAAALWSKLLRLYEGRAHRALGYTSWGSYFQAEFGQSSRHGYRLLEAARVQEGFSDTCVTELLNSRQAVELARIADPDLRVEVWQYLTAEYERPPTAAEIHEYVEGQQRGEEADHGFSENESARFQELAAIPEADFEAAIAAAMAEGEPITAAGITRLAPLMTSTTPEWFTPKEVLDAVVAVLGRIDLDPCAETHDNPNVPAQQHYTVEDDGLSQPWAGRVFMNPPYGRTIDKWIFRLIQAFGSGEITEAIALVPVRTDTNWWDWLMTGTARWCGILGRLHFSDSATGATFPSALVYFGLNVERFTLEAGGLGNVYIPVRFEDDETYAPAVGSCPAAGIYSDRGEGAE